MKNNVPSFCLLLCVAAFTGCSTLSDENTISDESLLEQAVAAIDDAASSCAALDESIEDEEFKSTIRSRRFVVLEVSQLTDEYGQYRQYVLHADTGDRFLGIVYFEGSACSKYSFGLLQNE